MLRVFLVLSILFSPVICFLTGKTGLSVIFFFLLFALLGFAALCLFFGCLILLYTRLLDLHPEETPPEKQGFQRWLYNQIVVLIHDVCRIRLKVEGAENIPEGTFLIAGNHRSNFDPIVTIRALGRHVPPAAYVSKPENFKIPVAGPLVRRLGFLAIDRDNDREALRTIMKAAEYMKEGRYCYGIYPEGTRSKTGEMLPFRNGCFKAAQRAKVPVLVAAVKHTDDIHKNWPLHSTTVTVRFCGVVPVETVAKNKTPETGDLVRSMLETALAEMEQQ